MNVTGTIPNLSSRHWDENANGYRFERHEALTFLESLGPIVYAVTFGPFVKIGWTAHIARRIHGLGTAARKEGFPACEILGFHFGTRADETATHQALREYRARGREFFHPTPEVLALVDSWRTN